jgi:hypothetical protein
LGVLRHGGVQMRWRRGGAVGLLLLVGLLLSAGPAASPAAAGGGVSDTVKYGDHTLTYTVTGVRTGSGDTQAHRSGTVTSTTVSVSGSASFTIDKSGVTNLSMSASLSVTGGASKLASWPPKGVNGRVSGQTVNFPFNLQVTIPPAPSFDEDDFPGAEPIPGGSPAPYATVSFDLSSKNCNDDGVCGGPEVDGTFLVFLGGQTGNTPGLGGVGNLPGPADGTQGLIGMLGPGFIGLLGGVLFGGLGGGTTAPVGPGGPVGTGGRAPTGDAAARAARSELTRLLNRAGVLKNQAMADAVNRAQAGAFDANGNLIPERWAALRQEIRNVAGAKTSLLDAYYNLPDEIRAPGDALSAGASTIGDTVGAVGDGAVNLIKGVGSGIYSAGHGLMQIGDAIAHPRMFARGLDDMAREFVTQNTGPEGKEFTQALRDGRFFDALGADLRATTKLLGAGASEAGSKVWGVARDLLPVDEVESFFDPNASAEERLWAVPAAASKIAGLLVGTEVGSAPVPGVSPNTTLIPSAAPGFAAGEAAEAAGAEAASTSGAAAEAAEQRQATALATQKAEQLGADALGAKPAPTNLRECQQILAQNPELRNAVDDAIRADGGSGSLHGLRQDGAMSSDMNNLITARKIELQEQAMNAAGKRIAEEETAARIANGEPPPRRIMTAESTEGNRTSATGANTRTDLDRTQLGLEHVTHERAEQILNEECAKLGFDRPTIDANVYTPAPGQLSDAAGAAPNSDAWIQRSLQRTSGRSGYHPVNVSSDGKITIGDHVGGSAGSEALPMDQRFNAPVQLSPTERAASVAHQLDGLDQAASANNVSGGVKFAARAIKDGAGFDGPTDAVMRAAMTKDPAAQMAILKEAGIGSVADLRARLQAPPQP